jgi:hypothetical protein
MYGRVGLLSMLLSGSCKRGTVESGVHVDGVVRREELFDMTVMAGEVDLRL